VLRIIVFLSLLLVSSLLMIEEGSKGCSGSGGVLDLEGASAGAII
jgi:hypothetical protein